MMERKRDRDIVTEKKRWRHTYREKEMETYLQRKRDGDIVTEKKRWRHSYREKEKAYRLKGE